MRKFVILLSGLLISKFLFGQQLIFRGLPVDTISVSSSSGYFHFDRKGTTTGKEDVYTIAFDKKANTYLVADYKRISILSTCEPAAANRKIRHLTQDKGKLLSNKTLDSLLLSFNERYNKPTFDNVGCDKQEFLSLTDEKHIRKVAKAYKKDWHFKMKYTTREENEILFNGCQNIDTFNLFLATKFDTTGYVMVTDVWDEMYVWIKTTDKWFSFEGKYPNPFKQPWYNHTESDSIPFYGTTDSVRHYMKIPLPIVNLNINKMLSSILPDEFHRKSTIMLPVLINQYIKWYLQRRDIIYAFE